MRVKQQDSRLLWCSPIALAGAAGFGLGPQRSKLWKLGIYLKGPLGSRSRYLATRIS